MLSNSIFARCLAHIWPDRGESSLRPEPLPWPTAFDYDLQVIIPVYNTARYLPQCLDSVCRQRSRYRICITVVNDGSTDASASIVQRYASHPGLEIVTQPNQGLSAARNAGLERLRAPRVYFLDSDDRLAADDALDVLLSLSIRSGADMTEGSMEKFNDAGQTLGQLLNADSLSAERLRGFACNKVIRAEVFSHYQFPRGYLFEDTLFGMLLFWRYRHWATSSRVTYLYRYNEQGLSIGSRGNRRIIDSHWVTRRMLSDYLQSGGELTSAYSQNLRQEFRSALRQVRTLRRPDVLLLVWADIRWILRRITD